MIGLVLLTLGLALPEDPAPRPSESPEAEARALAEYNTLRDKTPMTAAAQAKLAAWAEQHGLKSESYVHYANVIRLDPSRESAWRKLGFKKHGGRWMTDEQVSEEAEQKKADASWARKFRECHKAIHGGKKQAEARAVIDDLTDPKAVPALFREFGGGGESDQLIAVQALGQIDAPISSRTLAALAIYGKTPVVRRRALETLRRRPEEDFLGMFVALLRDPLRYAVRPVGGPGTPGVLFVEGEQFNVQRFYDPPAPGLPSRFGQQIAYGPDGSPMTTDTLVAGAPHGVKGSKSLVTQTDVDITYSIPNPMLQAQRAAMVAQGQLAGDVAAVEAMNEQRSQFNELVMAAAKGVIGTDPGKTPKEWREYLAKKLDKYAKRPVASGPKPTYSELVPIAFTYFVSAQTEFVTKTYVDT